MTEQVPSEQCISMECKALGCQRAHADEIIQDLRAKNTALINECMHYRQKLRDLSAAATDALKVTKT